MRNIALILTLALLWACNGKQQQAEDATTNKPTVESIPMDKNLYRAYVGTLNSNIPIHMNITKVEQNLHGSYYYDRDGVPIQLTKGKLNADGSFIFEEYGITEQVGSIEALFKGDKVMGFWYNKDKSKKLLMDLTLDSTKSLMEFDVFHESSLSYLVEDDTTSPTHTFIQTLMYPSIKYQGVHKEAIYGLFDKVFKSNLSKGNPMETIRNMQTQAIKEYREANLAIFKEEPSFGSSMNWAETAHMEVVYNSPRLLAMRQNWYNFTGGAHGNYGANYFVIDLEQGKRVVLDDIIQPKFRDEMGVILEQKVAERQGLAANETLQDIGIDTEAVKPTENFYLTHKGIGFYYAPYQIAPYAVGAIEVFVPFSECQSLLQEGIGEDGI